MRRLMIFVIALASMALACDLSPSVPTLVPVPTLASPTLFIGSTESFGATLTLAAPFITATDIPQISVATQVPQAPIACSYPANWAVYTVQAGDTLGTIAQRAQTTIDQLMSANCLSNPDLISVGQALHVPNALATRVTVTPAAPNNATVGAIAISPSILVNGVYQVAAGPITLTAIGVQGVTRVTFYFQQTNTPQSQPIGTDNNPTNGTATVTSSIQNVGVTGTIVAFGYGNNFVQVQGGYISVAFVNRGGATILPTLTTTAIPPVNPVATATPTATSNASATTTLTATSTNTSLPLSFGALTISPAPTANGVYLLSPGTVTLTVNGVQNVPQVFFYFQATGSTTRQLITVTNNPSGGVATGYWRVPAAPFSGTIVAVGNAIGGSVTSAPVSVASAP